MHIVRDPYAVFRSSRHIIATLFPYMHLQEPDPRAVDEDILGRYETVNDAYLRHRGQIPPGRLHELRFEDLERDPLGELCGLYRGLGYGGLGSRAARPGGLSRFPEGIPEECFRALKTGMKERIRERWRRHFEAFGYPV